jgi:formamidopyrimidine-DNA glycosylase
MPEFAEVEFYRRRWQRAASGQKITGVAVSGKGKPFRAGASSRMRRTLTGTRLESSEASAKQMAFRFTGGVWLGLHLGMTGELRVEPASYVRNRHDHLVLATARHRLVFSDPRRFGRIDLHVGPDAPSWWTKIAPAVLSKAFTVEAVSEFLSRHGRAPIKAVLLLQERFPGIGNWMADEVLWRAAIHPREPAGRLRPPEVRALWRECRRVCRLALAAIAGGDLRKSGRKGGHVDDAAPTSRGRIIDMTPSLNSGIPDTWLFHHRWAAGGRCPRTGVRLLRAKIGGRTTCWSPARQKLR